MSEWLQCRVIGEEHGGRMMWGVELWDAEKMQAARYGCSRQVQPMVRFCRACNRGMVSPRHADEILDNLCETMNAVIE